MSGEKLVHDLIQWNVDDPEFMFWCPGCKCGHWFKTTGDHPRWSWNENYDSPTITPSILIELKDHRCHSVITDGIIGFLDDCDHDLAGKHVRMEVF